ncbi:hypothetical protein LCGC14_0359290 [marine sediment metagenome]|uniref:Uncharacterized protein n=1 Tax=marine sediment metagenome TaxID=412755 RepID=A0A0F9TE72_9ZZZZ|nr:hypothetical protein [Candidatus Aminicenantes bacterium]
MAALKPSTNEGFSNPEPGHCLFQVKSVEFKKYTEGDNVDETYCNMKVEIIDCIEHEDNIGMPMWDRFNQFAINERFFGVENLLGVIWKATGKVLEVDEDYFLADKPQAKVTKQLVDAIYGGEIVLSTVGSGDKAKTYRNIRSYCTKEDYKDLVKKMAKEKKSDKKKPDADKEDSKKDSKDDSDDDDDW